MEDGGRRRQSKKEGGDGVGSGKRKMKGGGERNREMEMEGRTVEKGRTKGGRRERGAYGAIL
jgi:hypothetical protein